MMRKIKKFGTSNFSIPSNPFGGYSGYGGSGYGPSDIIGIGNGAFMLPDPAMRPRTITRTTTYTTFGGRGNLMDDVTDAILRRIQEHEDMIFNHVHRHNASVHDHHSRMSYHHPYHARGDHPLNRGRRGPGNHR